MVRSVVVATVLAAAVATGAGIGLAVAATEGGGDGHRRPHAESTGPTAAATATAAALSWDVDLDLGYCWVEHLHLPGAGSWDLPAESQFSAVARNTPPGISGHGTATLDGPDDEILDYVDDAGGRLTFVPSGDPRTLQDRVCE